MKTLYVVAMLALGQSRTIVVDEPGITLLKSEIGYLPDAGCTILTYASNDAGVIAATSAKPFNGSRCTTARTAATKQANLDLGVGDGTQP